MSKLVIVEQHNWLWIFCLFLYIYKIYIMQLFSADATLFKKKLPKKTEKMPSKVAYILSHKNGFLRDNNWNDSSSEY